MKGLCVTISLLAMKINQAIRKRRRRRRRRKRQRRRRRRRRRRKIRIVTSSQNYLIYLIIVHCEQLSIAYTHTPYANQIMISDDNSNTKKKEKKRKMQKMKCTHIIRFTLYYESAWKKSHSTQPLLHAVLNVSCKCVVKHIPECTFTFLTHRTKIVNFFFLHIYLNNWDRRIVEKNIK